MKKNILLLFLTSFILNGCSDDDDTIEQTATKAMVTLNFTHQWGEDEVTTNDFNTVQYENENGEQMSLERLRYLVSNVTLESADGSKTSINGYNLIDLTNDTGLTYVLPDSISTGKYTNVSFTFGFTNEDNQNGVYPDLNSALWNVPEMLGGGYHFMQLEGKFIDSLDAETGYQYHAIRAVDVTGEELIFEDTFFTVNLGAVEIKGDSEIEIKMDIAEWFKNPVKWNLNELHSMMMPNFEAQKMISQNGKSVFSLGEVTVQ